MELTRPDIIIFDYGDTLAWEPVPDFLRGWRAVFRYVSENPDGAAPEDAKNIGDELWQRFSGSRSLSAARNGGWEIHEWQQLRTVMEALGLKTSVPLEEAELILMENSCPSFLKPGVSEMINFLRSRNIPTGVISNIGWYGNALANRLQRIRHPQAGPSAVPYSAEKDLPACGKSLVLRQRLVCRRAGCPRRRDVPGVVQRKWRGAAGKSRYSLSLRRQLAGIYQYTIGNAKLTVKEREQWARLSHKKSSRHTLSAAK